MIIYYSGEGGGPIDGRARGCNPEDALTAAAVMLTYAMLGGQGRSQSKRLNKILEARRCSSTTQAGEESAPTSGRNSPGRG